MNTIWSDYCQKAETLFLTRTLRFDDLYREQYRSALQFPEKPSILEVGCGPGALCLALARWYPGSDLTGLDRDSAFLAFAEQKAREAGAGIRFAEGDAAALPFRDETFDAVISNTVVEHVETGAFFSQQYRVLKKGGVCAALSSCPGKAVHPESWNDPGPEEKAIMEKTERFFDESYEKYSICRYPLTERQLPAAMEQAGFRQVSTHYIAQPKTPDSADVPEERALAMIEANRQVALDCSRLAEALAPGVLTKTELQRWRELVNERFDRRVEQYRKKEKLWDTEVGLILIARGVKE